MAQNAVYGINSNLDTQDIINKMVSLEARSMDLVEAKKQIEQQKLASFQELKTKLQTFKSVVTKLNTESRFIVNKSVFSNNSFADSNKVVVAYKDAGNSNYGTAVVGTVSGTAISFGTAVVFNSALAPYTTSTFDSNSNKTVIAFKDEANSDYGTGIVGTLGNDFTVGSKYYVTTTGGYSTSAGSPSVSAGLAISTTSLLLNGDS